MSIPEDESEGIRYPIEKRRMDTATPNPNPLSCGISGDRSMNRDAGTGLNP
jgi:hypothetical protein